MLYSSDAPAQATVSPADTSQILRLTDEAWEIIETQTDEAERRLQQAVTLAQQLKFLRGEAAAWNGLGVVAEVRGNLTLAEKHYRKALVLRQKLGDKQEVANTLNNIGVLYEMQGRPDSAIAFHKQNLAIQQELKDTVRIARALFNIAGVLQETGDY